MNKKEFIDSLCLLKQQIDNVDPFSEETKNNFENIVNYIKNNDLSNFTLKELSSYALIEHNSIEAIKEELNNLIYRIYNLTEEEIKIIEDTIK